MIHWRPDKPYFYRYEFTNSGDTTSTDIQANAIAYGNLDGDDTNSLYRRSLNRLSSGLLKPEDLVVINELE